MGACYDRTVWRAHWQGYFIADRLFGELGLAAFELPPGSGPLVLRLALKPAQKWGTLVISIHPFGDAAWLSARGADGMPLVDYSVPEKIRFMVRSTRSRI